MTEEARASLPTVRAWQRGDPDAATPPCPCCGVLLGIREAMFTAHGRDVWLCDTHGEIDA